MPLIGKLQDANQLERLLLAGYNINSLLVENTAHQRMELQTQIENLKTALEVVNSMKSFGR